MNAIPTTADRKPRGPRPKRRAATWVLTAIAAGALLVVATPDAAFAGQNKDRKAHAKQVRGHDRGHDRFHRRDRSDRRHRHHDRGHHARGKRGKHNDGFRFEIRIGDRPKHHRRHHRHHVRHNCSCFQRVWVPPVYRTTYDPCGTRRTVMIRPGYYKTVRAGHGCAIHHRKGYRHRGHDSGVKIRIGSRF